MFLLHTPDDILLCEDDEELAEQMEKLTPEEQFYSRTYRI